jgi:hypothetical protein
VLGKAVDVAPITGTVLIAVPAGATISRAGGQLAAVAAAKGLKFVPLTNARQIPVGSFLDTSRGTVGVTAASGKQNIDFTGQFAGGIFQLLQGRTQKGLSTLNLQDTKPRATACAASIGKKAGVAKAKASNKVLGLLHSSVHGSFTTRGQYSSATARGTAWTIQDECAGTLVHVTRDVVSVENLATRKSILVHQGHSLLVPATASIGKHKGSKKGIRRAATRAVNSAAAEFGFEG